VWQRQPNSILVGGFPPRTVEILTPNRGVVLAEFQDYAPALPLRYAGTTILIGPIFIFAARTLAGDSGSPVMDGRQLCGMHFYGSPSSQVAMAHPADSIFDDSRFHVSIQLA
jgi:hypothetical protein